eukprot:Lithocolla_globosa_v1_NODE_8864_length_774_cov_138.393602.p1 type:complete len:198 gc:universal NODE_8864_length_774_cov_138.393602:738-145(-)
METAETAEKASAEKSSHPYVLFFHFFFRTTAIITYMFGSFFSSDFILLFVVCVLCLAFDFYTVKNISGRLLVGLRWWNEVRDDGSNLWVFESRKDREPNSYDSRLFWYSLYIFPAVWCVLGIIAIARLNFLWFLMVVMAVSMSVTNLFGYIKCQKDKDKNKKEKTGNPAENMAKDVAAPYVTNFMAQSVLEKAGSYF